MGSFLKLGCRDGARTNGAPVCCIHPYDPEAERPLSALFIFVQVSPDVGNL